MHYSISMTSRMMAIAGFCVFLLCVLLFLLGIELGKRFAEAAPVPAVPAAAVPNVPSAPTPALPAVPAPVLKP